MLRTTLIDIDDEFVHHLYANSVMRSLCFLCRHIGLHQSLSQRFGIDGVKLRRLSGNASFSGEPNQLIIHGQHRLGRRAAIDDIVDLERLSVANHVLNCRRHSHHFKHGNLPAVHRRNKTLGNDRLAKPSTAECEPAAAGWREICQ